jgi:hypothetical protein
MVDCLYSANNALGWEHEIVDDADEMISLLDGSRQCSNVRSKQFLRQNKSMTPFVVL